MAQHQRMIARGMHRIGVAVERGEASVQRRCAVRPLAPIEPVEIQTVRCEMVGHFLLSRTQHMDAEPVGRREGVVPFGRPRGGPQHQRRVQRHRGKAVGRHSQRPFGGARGDDRYPGAIAPESVAQVICRIGIGNETGHAVGHFGAVACGEAFVQHPSPAPQRRGGSHLRARPLTL